MKKISQSLRKYNSDAIKELLRVGSYREFIIRAMELQTLHGKKKKQSYSDLARRGGFSARSFPREVALGNRRLTLKSIGGFAKGLGLSSELSEFFRLLVELEEPECRSKNVSTERLRRNFETLRARLSSSSGISTKSSTDKDLIFRSRHIPRVYAALGSPSRGASLSEIQSRTGMAIQALESLLVQMQEAQIVTQSGDRYRAIQNHLSFEGLTETEIFKNFFLGLLTQAASHANMSFDSDERLYFSSAFSVSEADLPQLKKDLREVLLQYVDRSETQEGNRVVSLVCSLF